ncbi:MAG: hypothetical protein V1916_01355 [Patescibacteria group bacterium]
MVPLSRVSWQQSKIRHIARATALAFSILGLAPMEAIIPPLATEPMYRLLIVKVLVAYFILYVYVLVKSLRLLWCFDRQYLERMRVPLTRIQIGAKLVRTIRRMQPLMYRRSWPNLYKVFYLVGMFMLGIPPYAVKFGIALSILSPTRMGFIALVAGTTVRSIVLVYVGGDLFDLLFH